MSVYAEVWKRLTPSERKRTVAGGVLCLVGFILSVDMYFLKQRPDFQKKFNLPAESEQDNEEMDDSRPWRRKQQAQLDAEVAERSAQLAAAAAGIRSSATLQQHPPAQQPGPAAAAPEPNKQQPAKSWWSVKLNWRQ